MFLMVLMFKHMVTISITVLNNGYICFTLGVKCCIIRGIPIMHEVFQLECIDDRKH